MLREALAAAVVAAPFGIGVTVGSDPSSVELVETPELRFSDPEIVESSGLVVADGRFVTVNDSGDTGRVFTVDPQSGRTVGVTRWPADPTDVEALAPAGPGAVWVGDIGDNTETRDTVEVLEVPVGPGDRTVEPTTYRLRYPDGPRNAEALLAHPRTGRLYVATKDVFGGEVYAAPRTLDADRVNLLQPVGHVMPVVTDGAFLPDGRHLVLRDYGHAIVYAWPSLESRADVALPEQVQGEGLAADPDGGSIHVSSEGRRAPVYEVPLPQRVLQPASPSAGAPSPPFSREGSELPEKESEGRDPTQWLLGTGVIAVALLVLWRALRPTSRNPPR